MPRFGIKSLLIGIAVVAIWLSTLTDYRGAADVRSIILLLIFATSGLTAYFSNERQKAFWIGFVGVMFWYGMFEWSKYVPKFEWVRSLVDSDQQLDWSVVTPDSVRIMTPAGQAVVETVQASVMLFLALTAGVIGVYIFDQSRKTETE